VIRVKRPRAAAGGKRGHLGETDKGLCQALAYALCTKGRDQIRPLHGTRCVAAGRDGVMAGRGRRHLSVRGHLGREALNNHVERCDQLVRPYLRTDRRRAGQDPPL